MCIVYLNRWFQVLKLPEVNYNAKEWIHFAVFPAKSKAKEGGKITVDLFRPAEYDAFYSILKTAFSSLRYTFSKVCHLFRKGSAILAQGDLLDEGVTNCKYSFV